MRLLVKFHANLQVSFLGRSYISVNNSRLALNNDVSHSDKKSMYSRLCYMHVYSTATLRFTYHISSSLSCNDVRQAVCLYPMNVVQISCMGGVSVFATTR